MVDRIIKQWRAPHGTLCITTSRVIDKNGGSTVWSHEEFLHNDNKILYSILTAIYGSQVLDEVYKTLENLKKNG
jgi:hypothetical protein